MCVWCSQQALQQIFPCCEFTIAVLRNRILLLPITTPEPYRHWHGYGSLTDPGAFLQLPGSEHALAYNWRGDNAGPPMSANETLNDFAIVQKAFPGASVVSSTFEEFVEAVMADGADALLPEITRDLADTWTWGELYQCGGVGTRISFLGFLARFPASFICAPAMIMCVIFSGNPD